MIILRPDGTSLSFDATLSESHSDTIATTDHPVEGGATVTDHAQALPFVFSALVVVSETPLLPIESSEPTGTARLNAALDFLKACTGELLTLTTTKNGDMERMLLTRFSHVIMAKGAIELDLGFKQVTLAETGAVAITANKGGPNKAQIGRTIAQGRAAVASAFARDAASLQGASVAYRGADVVGVVGQ